LPWRPLPGDLSWAGGAVPRETPLQPSPEQDAIVAARRADPQGSLRVLAFAGTGKTTALQLLAEADPTPGLYLAYNKSTQLAARARFPAHVACRTIHSLAFRAMGMAGQQHRLERKLAGRDVAELLAIPALDGLRPSFWGYCVIAAVRNFTHDGAARAIGPEHLPPLPRGADRAGPVLAWARQVWALMRDPAGALPLEHDAYLKMWHLEGARLPDWAEVLYVDEAQDADPVTLAILQAQRRPTVWVGDPWQSIYRFRGSVNAMRMIGAPQRPLTRSWRFGEDLACVARAILAHTSAPPALALRGAPGLATVLGPVRPPCAELCRTNAGLFEAAVRGRDRVHLVGGVEPLARLVLGGWRLRQGEPAPEVPGLARFRGWDELVEEAKEARDPELRFLVQVVTHYGRALPTLVADLRRRAVAHPGMAARVLSTAHKAKGLEWPRVRLGADFPGLDELHAADRDGVPCLTPEERDQELHLLYVAATRARQQLEPNAAVRSCLAGRAAARQTSVA
jgi:AAA domain/UvrD-like helicase C-terminal domain